MDLRFLGYDDHLIRRLAFWSKRLWGKAYDAGTFTCTHPWVDMLEHIYSKPVTTLIGPTPADTPYLADWWFRMGTYAPQGRDALAFRFQIQTSEISTLRPNGVTHMEMLIAYGPLANTGYCLGVGEPVGAQPLNGTFGIHPFAPGLAGDGWFDDAPGFSTHVRYVQPELLELR